MIKRKNKYPLFNGLGTGIILQLAIGPVFFFIMNLILQRTIWDGFAGVLAVTIVDYFYIILAILGIGKLIEKDKLKKPFGIISSIVLIIFGIIIINSIINGGLSRTIDTNSISLFSSFISVLILTISSPMTIVFFTSLFTTKAVEYGYKRKELIQFGIGAGLATLLFMSISVLIFALIKGTIPLLIIQILNIIVGCLLIGYGGVRLIKVLKNKPHNKSKII